MNLTTALAIVATAEAAALTTITPAWYHARRSVAALYHQATHDHLTGIPNRRAANNRLAARLATGTTVSVVLIDIDDFKIINDDHGHDAGDAALKYVAARLKEAAAPYMVARYSGDEFLIIVDAGLHFAETIARAAMNRIQQTPFIYFGNHIPVDVSIGVAVADDTNDPTEIIRRADRAMYHVKRDATMNGIAWMPGMTMPQPSTTRRRNYRDAPQS